MNLNIRIIKVSSASKGGFLTKALNEYLKKKGNAIRPPRKRTIRPSEIGGCIRQTVMSILNIIKMPPITFRLQRIFDNGNSVHDRYLKGYLKKLSGIELLDVEKSLKNEEYWLSARPDALIRHLETGDKYVLELKSIKGRDFVNLRHPSFLYESQVRIYMFLSGISKAILFYENKDTQETKEFFLEEDSAKLDALLQRAKIIQGFVMKYDEEKKLPPKCQDGRCPACKAN